MGAESLHIGEGGYPHGPNAFPDRHWDFGDPSLTVGPGLEEHDRYITGDRNTGANGIVDEVMGTADQAAAEAIYADIAEALGGKAGLQAGAAVIMNRFVARNTDPSDAGSDLSEQGFAGTAGLRRVREQQ